MAEVQVKKSPVVITGASGSMGSAAVKGMVEAGYPVIMACRNLDKAEKIKSEIIAGVPEAEIDVRLLDLNYLESVRSFASSLNSVKISALFNNAGVICRDYDRTPDGFEQTMAVNFVAPALLSMLLAPNIEDGGHVVNMVSLTTKMASLGKDWETKGEKDFHQLPTYGSSKLALLYFTIAFARHNPSLIVNMSDPGIVNSNMISMHRWFDPLADVLFRPFCKSPEKGVAPALSALQADERLKYFVGKGWKEVPSRFLDSDMPEFLWNRISGLL